MKLLIIAGPYEADRIRKAAVSAGFETVAVEPGESLSGWINASRPDLIIMAPQIVNADPAVALAKVRSVPRGRVPIFLVGDAGDEKRLKPLADGFFVRPVAPGDLISQARARVTGTHPAADGEQAGNAAGPGNGTPPPPAPAETKTPKPTLGPPNLRPLIAQRAHRASSRGGVVSDPLQDLSESIEATLDAEIRDVVRSVGMSRRGGTPVGPPLRQPVPIPVPATPAPPVKTARGPAADLERTRMVPPDVAASGSGAQAVEDESDNEAVEELRDESSQKTVEVPRDVVAQMIGAGHPDVRTGADGKVLPGSGEPTAGRPAPIESGKLAERDVVVLMARIFVDRLTGWLTFKRDGAEKAIVFEKGVPVLAGSNLPEDRMGEMLVRQGRLSVEQHAQSAEILVNTGRRLGAVLVDLGFIKGSELNTLVRRHYEEIIYSLFAWESGEWSLGPDRPEKEETVFLAEDPAALIVEGIRRKYSAARLLACLGGAKRVLRLPGGRGTYEMLERLALTDEERQVIPLFDGVRTLEEIRMLTDASSEALFGVAWALLSLRQLQPVERQIEEPAGAAQAGNGKPEGADSTQIPGQGRDQGIDRARVLARFALVREGDYFQVLGVSRDASAQEIRRAHQTLAREFAAHALAPALSVELGSELRAIRTVLDEGLRILGDIRLRQRYQGHLPAPASRRSASD